MPSNLITSCLNLNLNIKLTTTLRIRPWWVLRIANDCWLWLLAHFFLESFALAISRRLFTKVMLTSDPELGSLDKLCRCRQSIFFAPRGCVGQLRGRFSFSKENTKGKRSTWQSPWLSDADAAIIHILGTLFLKPLRRKGVDQQAIVTAVATPYIQ